MFVHYISIIILGLVSIVNFRINMQMQHKPDISVSYFWEDAIYILDRYKESLKALFKVEIVIFILILGNVIYLMAVSENVMKILQDNETFMYFMILLFLSILNLFLTNSLKTGVKNKKNNAEKFYTRHFGFFDKEYDLYKKDLEKIIGRLDSTFAITFKDFANEYLLTSKAYNIQKQDIDFIESLLSGKVVQKDIEKLQDLVEKCMINNSQNVDVLDEK